MSAFAELALLLLVGLVRWTFKRPARMIPVRLALLALVMIVASGMVGR